MPIPKPRNILPFRHNRPLQVMVLWLLVLWIITAIEPFNRRDWLLENLLVFVYSGLLVFSYPRFAFSNLSYALFTVFLSLHLIGAHYTYEHAPPGDWLQALFDVQRNHYDRIVHFCFGLLIAHPFRELLLRAAGVRPVELPPEQCDGARRPGTDGPLGHAEPLGKNPGNRRVPATAFPGYGDSDLTRHFSAVP